MRDSEWVRDAGALQDAARLALDYHRWLAAPDGDAEEQVLVGPGRARRAGAPTASRCLMPPGAPGSGSSAAGRARRCAPHWCGAGARWACSAPRCRSPGRPRSGPTSPGIRRSGSAASCGRSPRRRGRRSTCSSRWSGDGCAARAAVAAGRRRTSRTPAAVDLLAAVPLVSATTLAAALEMSVKAACAILDELVRLEVAVEVTHRHSRRLFGLAGLAPLRQAAAPPRRPLPGRGRGRPREVPAVVEVPPEVLPPVAAARRAARAAGLRLRRPGGGDAGHGRGDPEGAGRARAGGRDRTGRRRRCGVRGLGWRPEGIGATTGVTSPGGRGPGMVRRVPRRWPVGEMLGHGQRPQRCAGPILRPATQRCGDDCVIRLRSGPPDGSITARVAQACKVA